MIAPVTPLERTPSANAVIAPPVCVTGPSFACNRTVPVPAVMFCVSVIVVAHSVTLSSVVTIPLVSTVPTSSAFASR